MTSSSSFAAVDRFVAALEYRIQTAIAHMADQAPPTIRCRFQQGRLLVLAEANQAANTADDRDERFQVLATALGTGLAETELPEELLDAQGELPVRLYLRERGNASPYAARSWSWKPSDAFSDLFDRAATGAIGWLPSESEAIASGSLVLLSRRDLEDPLSIDQRISTPDPTEATLPFWRPWQWRPWTTMKQALPQRWPQPRPDQWFKGKSFPLFQQWETWPWRLVSGLVVAGLAVGAIAYGVSRPCLIGSCERRQTASDLSQTALAQLDNNPIPEQVAHAHQDLQKAVNLLSAIPPWSPHYDTAQADLVRYRTQLADVEWILAAQKNASLAAQKSLNPPHPVPVWVEVHLLWQKAVIHLKRVPDDSPVAAFAQQKLKEYQANYQTIGQRLKVEEAAEANLNKAIEAGQQATTQSENATTLADWLAAQSAWENALNALSRIPKGTLAYEEARSLLAEYRSQQVQTRTRVTFEKSGERAYQEALASASEAQTAAQRNQWTQAVEQWTQATAQLRQVPKDTLRYAETQNQLPVYENSLKQAQGRLKQAVALETIEDDLQALCPLETGVCTYSLSNQQISLTLRDPYDAAVRQSISPPSTQGHLNQSDSVVAETHQLVQNIMRLGNRIQLPITLYDVDLRFIARYLPEHGGFVKD